jgi:hypothetical protein
MPNTKSLPPTDVDPGAVGVDQQRDAPGGIERSGRGRSGRMRLPHERDEAPTPLADPRRESVGPREVIEQAARDVARGLADTERRGTPNDLPRPRPRGGKRGEAK